MWFGLSGPNNVCGHKYETPMPPFWKAVGRGRGGGGGGHRRHVLDRLPHTLVGAQRASKHSWSQRANAHTHTHTHTHLLRTSLAHIRHLPSLAVTCRHLPSLERYWTVTDAVRKYAQGTYTSGKLNQVWVILYGFVNSSTHNITPHGGASYVQMSNPT